MKPGYRTTEFWLASAATLLGIVMASGLIQPDTIWDRIAGAIAATLAAMGYSYSRGLTKARDS